jgi:hypothetical protein
MRGGRFRIRLTRWYGRAMEIEKGVCERCGKNRLLSRWKPNATEMRLCARCIAEERATRTAALIAAGSGGAQPGAGRKISENPRAAKVMLAFTCDEMQDVDAAASLAGERPAAFGRAATLERAHRLLRAHKSNQR